MQNQRTHDLAVVNRIIDGEPYKGNDPTKKKSWNAVYENEIKVSEEVSKKKYAALYDDVKNACHSTDGNKVCDRFICTHFLIDSLDTLLSTPCIRTSALCNYIQQRPACV